MDINCDLGEGEPATRTRALLRCVTSASIACGGHAGDLRSLRFCLRLCRELGVKAGAHPGFFDRENFGRVRQDLSASGLELLLAQQIGAFLLVAREEKTSLSHVKLHGALYHATEEDSRLAKAYVGFIRTHHPRTRIIALAGGRVIRLAEKMGVRAWGEVFADRRYLPDGRLVPRGTPGAVIENAKEVQAQLTHLRSGRLAAQTVCVHGDSPEALTIARLLKKQLAA